jgi:muconate cycloisomerase
VPTLPRSSVQFLRIFPLSIPLRRAFEHAAHERRAADPLVVQVELVDGTIGYGETLPRPYVTGETHESVINAIERTLFRRVLELNPTCFPDALEAIDALPMTDDEGRLIAAARAGVELALLDAYSRHFGRPMSDVAGWMGLPGFGEPGSTKAVRYSGVLSGGPIDRVKSSLRKMRWFGLRDFKLKVGYDDDLERVNAVLDTLGDALGSSVTLRLDANGAWSLEQAGERLAAMGDMPIRCVEQPLPRNRDGDLVVLRGAIQLDLMHDESLITLDDARRLLDLGVADAFNIRISKNGGLMPALRLADFARKTDVVYQLGCMVGETSILSAAGRRFLESAPGAAFAEGSYGRFLLLGDVVDKPVQFGCAGKFSSLPGPGWGVNVQPERLQRYLADSVIEYPL